MIQEIETSQKARPCNHPDHAARGLLSSRSSGTRATQGTHNQLRSPKQRAHTAPPARASSQRGRAVMVECLAGHPGVEPELLADPLGHGLGIGELGIGADADAHHGLAADLDR